MAVGGDLSAQRLINAYANGIFPWYSEGEPLLWWSPDPRMVLFPKDVHISKRMKRLISKDLFQFTLDREFAEVVDHCRAPRRDQDGTWITDEMVDAYNHLHDLGVAHSGEVWQNDQLVGGIYGISLGRCFFGESMFSLVDNASKFVFIKLAQWLESMNFSMLDGQVPSEHLRTLGAVEIPREEFLSILQESLNHETITGNWSQLL